MDVASGLVSAIGPTMGKFPAPSAWCPGECSSSASSRERYIGTQANVVLGWEPTRNLSFEVMDSVFEPGPFIEETRPARSVHFVGAETLVRF